MINKLRDPFWHGVFAIIAILITILIPWLQQSRKEVSYQIVSETPLVSTQDEVSNRLEIFFDGKKVEDVTLMVLRLTNSGNTPIIRTDYDEPIVFDFTQDTEILSAEILTTKPDNMEANLIVDETSFTLEPVLLNSNDTIDIKVIMANYQDRMRVDARIIGVEDLTWTTPDNNTLITIMIFIAWILVVIEVSISFKYKSYDKMRIFIVLDTIVVILAIIATINYIIFSI